jgi:enediyne biosynthesis protein E4
MRGGDSTRMAASRQTNRWLPGAALLVAAVAGASSSAEPKPIRLVDATAESGIEFLHTDGGSGQHYLMEFMTAGLALLDYDNDGLIDLYFLNGAALPGTVFDQPPRNALYRNHGDGTFTEVTEQAGLGDTGFGLGVTVGDYNNNGYQDVYLNNFGPNVLYRNNGDGTFSDVTEQAAVDAGDQFGAGACFLDIDGDGALDLYVANYLDFTYELHAIRSRSAHPYPPGPQDFPPVPDTLYRNNRDGTFTDISQRSGIGNVAGTGMGVICFDHIGNGYPDIFVCNDALPNFLFSNDGRGVFRETALLAGLAHDFFGNNNGSMGADCSDYDNDGRLDLFMTNYTGERPLLYRNLGDGLFEDFASRAGIGGATVPHTKWGVGLVDFANRGRPDIFIACGHFLRNIQQIDDRTTYRVRNLLLQNTGNGRFTDVSNCSGDGLAVEDSSRGVAFDDLNNNGRVDVVVLNANSRPTVLRNESQGGPHWLQIHLRGVTSNRDGVGARVRVVAGDLSQVREVHSGRGYQSHYGTRLHFGLGHRDHVERIEVRWPGGSSEVFTDVPVDRRVVLLQGAGAVE